MQHNPLSQSARRPGPRLVLARVALSAVALALVGGTGFWLAVADAHPQAAAPQAPAAPMDYNTLRVYGYPVVSNPFEGPFANRPATAGSNTVADPITGRLPEDPPYTDLQGPFDPLSDEAPEMDLVTWNPAWISERLADPTLRAQWPGLTGVDEVSRDAHVRAGSVDASEKVWRRHWYEPQHLDKDLNADGRLTDADNNGVPDAPANPIASNIDEWYPAVMTEYTYMLVDNDPLPQRSPVPSQLHRSAPRPVCGRAGQTQFVFPIGVARSQLAPNGPLEGYGLTSLDADFDSRLDMVTVSDELRLANTLNNTRIDFDGDGVLEPINRDGAPLTCDELAVFHTTAVTVRTGQTVQFLDHFLTLDSVTDSAAVVEVWYNGDLVPRLLQTRSVGTGAVVLAGENGPVQVVAPGGTNLGSVPTGPWFAYIVDADSADGTAVLLVGRALGAPCASMEFAPNQSNRARGGPAFLKRFYVDGHEYNVAAIATCDADTFQYITLRNPLPKVAAIIEQHSVRLQPYGTLTALPQPPPFNHEHTVLEDIRSFQRFPNIDVPPNTVPPVITRPTTIYMGGPVGPVAPVLARNEGAPYTGRLGQAVGPYNDTRAMRWFYSDESTNPQAVGQLREKYGAVRPDVDQPTIGQEGFFYNEQIWTMPWNYTEFVLPNHPDPAGSPQPYDADNYHVTSAFESPTARWRRWTMPDTGVPASIPPVPPDLTVNNTPDGDAPLGAPRRAVFWFSPDFPAQNPVKLWTDSGGVRLFGGQPERTDFPCDPARPSLYGTNNGTVAGSAAGDRRIVSDATSVRLLGRANAYPVEVLPYTDPFAAFNPQHDHAPPGDSVTVNPAYMDEFRNFNEDLRTLYGQISNDEQNAREKVYHRMWYEPEYIDKIRSTDECDSDLRFPALMQEYTYLFMDTTDNPEAAPPGSSRLAFPIGTRANELPVPLAGGTLPAVGGEFGYGLTTFDSNFDGVDEAVTVHSERTLASYLDTQWQSHRPTIPGFPLPPVPGPRLDFDGDTVLDALDADGRPLNGNELVVFAVESVVLDLNPNTPETANAMVLDHLLQLENVTRGARAQFRFWFTGGNGTNARPELVDGVRSLDIGDAAIVDRFQNTITVVKPGQQNPNTNGAWFAFVEDVASDSDRVTVTIGRALGATHSAIDDDNGNHDLLRGDPWYLKRFFVDGHEYNVVAVMTQDGGPGRGADFAYITLRTPVPKGNFLNSQDTLFLQGYFLNNLPPTVSVLPPYNVEHTMALDVERMPAADFANTREYDPCVGSLAAARPFVVNITAETRETRYGTELLELFNRVVGDNQTRYGWQTDQVLVTPYNYTEVRLPGGQQYLYTSNWRSPVSRLHFYGCTRITPPPFPQGVPGLTHQQLAALAAAWSSVPAWFEPPNLLAPPNIIPAPNQLHPPQPNPIVLPGFVPQYANYFDARLGDPSVRVKIFYDPADNNDWYINRRNLDYPEPGGGPTATPTATLPAGVTPTATTPGGATPTRTATPTATVPSIVTATPTRTATPTATLPAGGGAPLNALCQVVNQYQIEVTWTDASTFETEFLIEISVNGAPFAPINPPVQSTTQAGTGQLYQYTTPNLAAGTQYRFRIQARNPGIGQASPYSNTTGICQTDSQAGKAGCYKGKIYLQGRSEHSGTLIFMDGIPMVSTTSDGRWELCGATPGNHTLRATGACYLPVQGQYTLPMGGTIQLPTINLPGGDVNNDVRVDLFDLVRVGADYRSSPPTDPPADCNRDNVVNLFDLVMVGTNYGDIGPVSWNDPDIDPPNSRPADVTGLPRAARGDADGAPLALALRPLQDGTLAVDVTVHKVSGLYGADIRLAYDPARIEVLDSLEKAGIQVQPGDIWVNGGAGFVPVNRVDALKGEVRFSATLMNPAEPVNGDVVIATVKVRPLDGSDGKGAIALSGVALAGKHPNGAIAVRWEGVDVYPLVDVSTLTRKVYLPWLGTGRD